MKPTIAVAFAVACACVVSACSSNKSNSDLPPPPAMQPSTAGGQPIGPSGTGGATTAGSIGTVGAGTRASGGSGSTAAGTGGTPATGQDAGQPPVDAGPRDPQVTPGLPLESTPVDVTGNIKRRFGAPHVAVNPKDPNNIVVLASSNLGYTRDCVPAPAGSDCEMIAAGGNLFLQQPRGFAKTAGFMDIGVFVSFDRGKTFKQIDVSDLVPPGHPEVRARGEGPIAATRDGTFYIGFNAINWGSWETPPITFFPNGGVGVIKSTDGGMTWKWMSYSFTPADWPYGGADPTTGTFYVTSGLAGVSALGSRSNGMPGAPQGTITDRWISSTNDGVTWTDPRPLGGTNGASHVGASHSSVAAAHGIMATLFLMANSASCSFFVGPGTTSSCVVFQTSTDAGATWSRHRVPVPAGFAPAGLSVLLGADPTKKGAFTVALLNESGSNFLVFRTVDAGETWTGPVTVTEDATKTHFAPFAATAPTGEFGLMWRTYEPDPAKPRASAPYMPYSVWAAVSKDGGTTFSKPLKVSKANSPAPPDDPNDAFSFIGDHGPSGMAMDGEGGVYVVWADWTPGERAIFFSAINVKAFEN